VDDQWIHLLDPHPRETLRRCQLLARENGCLPMTQHRGNLTQTWSGSDCPWLGKPVEEVDSVDHVAVGQGKARQSKAKQSKAKQSKAKPPEQGCKLSVCELCWMEDWTCSCPSIPGPFRWPELEVLGAIGTYSVPRRTRRLSEAEVMRAFRAADGHPSQFRTKEISRPLSADSCQPHAASCPAPSGPSGPVGPPGGRVPPNWDAGPKLFDMMKPGHADAVTP
jgi:hypothetical protein